MRKKLSRILSFFFDFVDLRAKRVRRFVVMAMVLATVLQQTKLSASTVKVPEPAATVGYKTLTFASNDFTRQNVDMDSDDKSGKSWYLWNFFGRKQGAGNVKMFKDGSIGLNSSQYNGSITSVALAKNAKGFVGTAFGGGGYFEAEISFSAADVKTPNGWPAWWALTLDSILEYKNSFWLGQSAGYRHTVELDFFEYLEEHQNGARNNYSSGIHEWYGNKEKCQPKNLCDFRPSRSNTLKFAPLNINWSQFHKIGTLWVPATDRKDGYLNFYLDGKQVGDGVSWQRFRNFPPPPTDLTKWAFGILDQMHLVLVLGSGTDVPMVVRSVHVWQRDAHYNLAN